MARFPNDSDEHKVLTEIRNAFDQERFKLKPNVVLQGAFDGGKSRLGNGLMGRTIFPVDYQPTTSLITIARHISDRPIPTDDKVWMADDVWILNKDFKIGQMNDNDHVGHCRITSGSIELLSNYGTHDGKARDRDLATYAFVFVDAPLLTVCNLIDTAGYGNDEHDSELAYSIVNHIDILLYLSNATGFLKNNEITLLKGLLPSLVGMDRLFIVATHTANDISNQKLDEIRSKAAHRLYCDCEDTFNDLGPKWDTVVTERAVIERIFSYWQEIPARCQRLHDALQQLIMVDIPQQKVTHLNKAIEGLKNDYCLKITGELETLQMALQNRELLQAAVDELKSREPERQTHFKTAREEIKTAIANYRRDHKSKLDDAYVKTLNLVSVEALIRNYWTNRKEATEHVSTKIIDRLDSVSNGYVNKASTELKEKIDVFLNDYNNAALLKVEGHEFLESIRIPFDAYGAFIGGMAGLGTLGALAFWASTLGNLGGYIIVAKLVSLLAAMGISISGGTATTISLVAALGGPAVLAVALSILAAVALWSLFGESWQKRLAKKIVKMFEEKGIRDLLRKRADTYWENTEKAFDQAADAVEKAFVEHLEKQERMLCEDAPEIIQERIRRYDILRDFINAIPWLRLSA